MRAVYSGVLYRCHARRVATPSRDKKQMVLWFGEWCPLCRLGARSRSGAHFLNANRDSEVSRIDEDYYHTDIILARGRCWLGEGANVVDRMCCCNLLLKANGMATAMLRRVAWVPGACGRFFFGGKQTSKQAKLKRRQQGRSTAKRI